MKNKQSTPHIPHSTSHNPDSKYQLICGMEVHAELKTKSKMFCGCKNEPFHAEAPNIHTCPVCLGMPGGLPVANKTAIEWTIKLGLALNCKINLFSKFDRKHYFYPDLPKGYQISQYDLPFCYDGYLETSFGKVRIRRIHLEEDTAKLIHGEVDGQKASMIDFNRSSVPLVELVTEADIVSPAHAAEYCKKLRELLRYLDIADCDMEQGGMRLEANVSLMESGMMESWKVENQKSTTPHSTFQHFDRSQLSEAQLPKYKVELKNINSFRFLEGAISYEMERQEELLEAGTTPIQETRGYNSVKGTTFSQRTKEAAEDYRYFPDPDLPPIRFTEAEISNFKLQIPKLPEFVRAQFMRVYGLSENTAQLLSEDQQTVAWIEAVFSKAEKAGIKSTTIANAIVNKKLLVDAKTEPAEVIAQFKALTATDSVDLDELQTAIKTVVAGNPEAVAKIKEGQQQIVGFFIGQVMRALGKKIDPQLVREELMKVIAA